MCMKCEANEFQQEMEMDNFHILLQKPHPARHAPAQARLARYKTH